MAEETKCVRERSGYTLFRGAGNPADGAHVGPCRTCKWARRARRDPRNNAARIKCTNRDAVAYGKLLNYLDAIRREGCYSAKDVR